MKLDPFAGITLSRPPLASEILSPARRARGTAPKTASDPARLTQRWAGVVRSRRRDPELEPTAQIRVVPDPGWGQARERNDDSSATLDGSLPRPSATGRGGGTCESIVILPGLD